MAVTASARPPQQDLCGVLASHSTLHCQSPASRQQFSEPYPRCRQQQQRLGQRLRVSGGSQSRPPAALPPAAATRAVPEVGQRGEELQDGAGVVSSGADEAQQLAVLPQQGQRRRQLSQQRRPLMDVSAVESDTDVVEFLFRQYELYERRQARRRAERALAALRAEQPGAEALSLRRDVLPKLELLEALSPGLGWRVFARYPEEFASPEAVERWRLAAAYLFTVGIPPEQITGLFVRHTTLLRAAVAQPDSLRRLFDWLSGDLGLPSDALVKLLNRCPAVLQADVEAVLKPRLRFFTDVLGLPQERAVTGLLRCPEALGIDTRVLAAKAAYLGGELGMAPREVGALFVREPAALLVSLPRLQETVAWLRAELGCDAELARKVVAKGGAAKYPLATLQERVAFWQGLGFAPAELRQLLGAAPRLLLYPMHEPKYQAKLRFLREELGLPVRALLAFPAYVSYSLTGRIAPRAAAARELAGRPLYLQQLAVGDERFARWLGVPAEEWAAWEAAWQQGPEAQRWEAAACEHVPRVARRRRGGKAALAGNA